MCIVYIVYIITYFITYFFKNKMNSSKNIVLLHGKGGLVKGGWFDEIVVFACKKKIPLLSESFPVGETIMYAAWKEKFEECILPFLHEKSIVVAHSLGCGFWQKYFTENTAKFEVDTVIFASPTVKWSGTESIKDFFTEERDYQNIQKSAKNFAVIGGGKDEYIGAEQFLFLSEELNATYFYYPEMTHMSQRKYSHHPEVLELLDSIFSEN